MADQNIHEASDGVSQQNRPKLVSNFQRVKLGRSVHASDDFNSSDRQGLILFSQRVVAGRSLYCLTAHCDLSGMIILEGWVTDSNGILPVSVLKPICPNPGSESSWLIQVFYEVCPLKKTNDDQPMYTYLVNFYVKTSTISGDDCDQSENKFSVSPKEKQPPPKFNHQEVTVPAANTYVQMCSVNAQRRCSRKHCLAGKRPKNRQTPNKDSEFHFDTLIENIFRGAILAEHNIVSTFLNNDRLIKRAGHIPRSGLGTGMENFLLSKSVELASGDVGAKRSPQAESVIYRVPAITSSDSQQRNPSSPDKRPRGIKQSRSTDNYQISENKRRDYRYKTSPALESTKSETSGFSKGARRSSGLWTVNHHDSNTATEQHHTPISGKLRKSLIPEPWSIQPLKPACEVSKPNDSFIGPPKPPCETSPDSQSDLSSETRTLCYRSEDSGSDKTSFSSSVTYTNSYSRPWDCTPEDKTRHRFGKCFSCCSV